MGISTPAFAVKDGEDCVTITSQHGDTTSSKASHIKRERPDEWAALAPAYDAWKADAKAQKEAKGETTPGPAPAPDNGDDDDDDRNGKAGTRRTLAKGYRK